MKPTPGQPSSHHDRAAETDPAVSADETGPAVSADETGPAVEDHGRVLTTNRLAAAFYRQAQHAVDPRQATTALRRAVKADPAFGLALADLDAVTGRTGDGPSRRQMNWERHHIEVVRTAASGNAKRAAGLLREHLATVGCDPLATRIAAGLRHPRDRDDDFTDLLGQLPSCHATPWPSSP